MDKQAFGEHFKKLRLRAGIATLAELGELLSWKEVVVDNSTLSYWQSGTKIPDDRKKLLAVLEIFSERDQYLSREDCNTFLDLAGHGNLSPGELERLHLSYQAITPPSSQQEPYEAEQEDWLYSLVLKGIEDSSNLLSSVEEQLNLQYIAIYEGHQFEAARKLAEIIRLIELQGLDKSKEGTRLLCRAKALSVSYLVS